MLILNEVDKYAYSSTILLDSTKLTNDWGIILLTYSPSNHQYQLQIAFPDHGFYILPSKYQISPPMTSDFTLPTPSFTQYLAWNAQYQTLFLYLHHELYVIHLEWYHLYHQTSISYQELALLLTTKGTSSTSTDSELCFNQIDVRFHLYSKEMILGQCLSMNLSTPTSPSMMILISSQCFCHILLSFQPTNSSSSSTSTGFSSLDPSFTSHSSYLHIQKHLQITKHMIYLSENHGDRQLLPVWQTNLLSWQLIPQETPSFEHSEHNQPEHKQEYLQCAIQQIHWLESLSSYWIVYEDGSFVLYHITQHHNSSAAYNSSVHTSSVGYSSSTTSSTAVSAASLAASNANIASMEHISPLYRTTRAYMIIQSAYPLKTASNSSSPSSQHPCCHEYHSFIHHNNASPNTPTNTSMTNNTHHTLSSNTQYTTKEEIISFVKDQRDLNHRPLLNTLTKTQVKALTNGIQHEEITNISDLIIISEDVSSGQIKYMMLLMTRHLVEYIEEHTSECIDVTYSLAIGVLQQQITTTFPTKSNQINPHSASIFKQMQYSFIQIINLSQVSFPRMMVSGVLQRYSTPSAYSTPQSTPDAESTLDSPTSIPPLSKRVRKHHLELIKSKLSSTSIGKNTRGSSSTATTPSASSSFFPATPRRSFTYDDKQQQTVLQSPSFGDPMITPTTPTSSTSSSSSTSSNYHIFVSIDDKIFSIDYHDSYVHTEQDSLVFQSSFQTPWKTPPPLPSFSSSPTSSSAVTSTTNYAYSRVLYCQNKLLFLQNDIYSPLLTTSKLRLSIFPILHQVNNVYPMLTSSINAMLTPLQHQLDMISTQETTLSYYLNQREGYLLIKQPCSSTYSSSFGGSDEDNQESMDPLESNSTSKHTNTLSSPSSIPMKTYSLPTLQHPSSSTDFIAKGSHQLIKIMLPKSLYFSGLIQHFQMFSSSNLTWFGIHDNQNHRTYAPSPVRFDTHEELHSYFVCYQSMISASTMSMMMKTTSFVSNTLQTMLKNIDYLNTTGQEIWIYNRNTFRWRSMTLSNASIGLLTDIPSIESYYTMPYTNNNMLNSASNSSNMLLSKGNNTSSHSLLSSSLDDYDDSQPNSRMNSLDLTPIEEETEDESSNSSKNNNNKNNNSHGFNYSDLFLVTSPTHNDNHQHSNNHTNFSTSNINRPPKIPIHQYKYMGKVYTPANANLPGQSTPSLNNTKENEKENNKKKGLQKKKPWEKKTKWISITNRPQLLQSPCLILASYWYDNHTLLLITIRKRQYYLEIISREPLMAPSTAGVLTKPPKVHRMVALPLGFKPSFIDVVLENHRTSSSTSSTSFMAEDGGNNNPTYPLPNTPCTSAIIMLSDGQYILTYWIQAIVQSIIPPTSSTSSSTSTTIHTTTSSTLESLTLDEENTNSGYQGIIHQSSVKTNVLDYRIVELWNLHCNQLIFDPFTTSQWNIHSGLSHDTSTSSSSTSAENIPIPEHRLSSFQSIHIYHIQYPFYKKDNVFYWEQAQSQDIPYIAMLAVTVTGDILLIDPYLKTYFLIYQSTSPLSNVLQLHIFTKQMFSIDSLDITRSTSTLALLESNEALVIERTSSKLLKIVENKLSQWLKILQFQDIPYDNAWLTPLPTSKFLVGTFSHLLWCPWKATPIVTISNTSKQNSCSSSLLTLTLPSRKLYSTNIVSSSSSYTSSLSHCCISFASLITMQLLQQMHSLCQLTTHITQTTNSTTPDSTPAHLRNNSSTPSTPTTTPEHHLSHTLAIYRERSWLFLQLITNWYSFFDPFVALPTESKENGCLNSMNNNLPEDISPRWILQYHQLSSSSQQSSASISTKKSLIFSFRMFIDSIEHHLLQSIANYKHSYAPDTSPTSTSSDKNKITNYQTSDLFAYHLTTCILYHCSPMIVHEIWTRLLRKIELKHTKELFPISILRTDWIQFMTQLYPWECLRYYSLIECYLMSQSNENNVFLSSSFASSYASLYNRTLHPSSSTSLMNLQHSLRLLTSLCDLSGGNESLFSFYICLYWVMTFFHHAIRCQHLSEAMQCLTYFQRLHDGFLCYSQELEDKYVNNDQEHVKPLSYQQVHIEEEKLSIAWKIILKKAYERRVQPLLFVPTKFKRFLPPSSTSSPHEEHPHTWGDWLYQTFSWSASTPSTSTSASSLSPKTISCSYTYAHISPSIEIQLIHQQWQEIIQQWKEYHKGSLKHCLIYSLPISSSPSQSTSSSSKSPKSTKSPPPQSYLILAKSLTYWTYYLFPWLQSILYPIKDIHTLNQIQSTASFSTMLDLRKLLLLANVFSYQPGHKQCLEVIQSMKSTTMHQFASFACCNFASISSFTTATLTTSTTTMSTWNYLSIWSLYLQTLQLKWQHFVSLIHMNKYLLSLSSTSSHSFTSSPRTTHNSTQKTSSEINSSPSSASAPTNLTLFWQFIDQNIYDHKYQQFLYKNILIEDFTNELTKLQQASNHSNHAISSLQTSLPLSFMSENASPSTTSSSMISSSILAHEYFLLLPTQGTNKLKQSNQSSSYPDYSDEPDHLSSSSPSSTSPSNDLFPIPEEDSMLSELLDQRIVHNLSHLFDLSSSSSNPQAITSSFTILHILRHWLFGHLVIGDYAMIWYTFTQIALLVHPSLHTHIENITQYFSDPILQSLYLESPTIYEDQRELYQEKTDKMIESMEMLIDALIATTKN